MKNEIDCPCYFHLGIQRAGSTYFYNLLSNHPEVTLSDYKEVNFYNIEYEKGFEWYLDTFKGKGVCIDTSIKYFMDGEKCSKLIASALGAQVPKFLVMFRNPIDYVYSHFQTQLRTGYIHSRTDLYPDVPENFIDFLELYPEYLNRAFFAMNLEKYWLSIFDEKDFLFVCFEEFLEDTNLHLKKILHFFNLEYIQLNTSDTSKHRLMNNVFWYKLSKLLEQMPSFKKWLKQNIVVNWVYNNFLTNGKPSLSESERKWLANKLKVDVLKLRELTNMNFESWKEFST